jgi:hypothetical protein
MARIPPSEPPGLAEYEKALREASSLEPRLGELARLVVVRRSGFESERAREGARAADLKGAVWNAVDSEDWTDEVFDARQKMVFQYALLYDAGHGLSDRLFAQVRAEFSAREIEDLGAWCGYWGGRARQAIALEYDV